MRLITNFLIFAVAGTALAQAPASKPATPATKPAATAATSKPAQAAATKPMPSNTAKPQTTSAKPMTAAPAKPATTTAAKPAMPAAKSPMSAKPVQKAAGSKTAKPGKVVVKKEAAPAKPAAADDKDKKPADTEANAKNRRDPFLSVVVNREGAPCAGGGKKCIDIAQVTLQGVVRAPNGPIAVISSGANKTFFLRENDPVYNGVVVKISPDSIVFRETVMDRVGKTSQREVVKKIHNAPAV